MKVRHAVVARDDGRGARAGPAGALGAHARDFAKVARLAGFAHDISGKSASGNIRMTKRKGVLEGADEAVEFGGEMPHVRRGQDVVRRLREAVVQEPVVEMVVKLGGKSEQNRAGIGGRHRTLL